MSCFCIFARSHDNNRIIKRFVTWNSLAYYKTQTTVLKQLHSVSLCGFVTFATRCHTPKAKHVYKYRWAFEGSRILICRSERQWLRSVALLGTQVHWFLLKWLNCQSQKVNGVILHVLRHRSWAAGCEGALTFSTQFRLKVRVLWRFCICSTT